MTGKEIRINHLSKNKRFLCVPLDHGITMNNIGNLYDFKNTVRAIDNNGATAIVVHKGMVRFLPNLNNVGIIIHLSASTNKNAEVHKVIVGSAMEAIREGASGVSIHVNLGNDFEKNMLQDFAKISRECKELQIPLLAMMYIRDNNNNDISTPDDVKHAIRIATELGADIVKISFKWDYKILKEVIQDSLIPVIIAGGELFYDETKLVEWTKQLMKSGIDGISYGRNIFLSSNPNSMTYQLSKVVFG